MAYGESRVKIYNDSEKQIESEDRNKYSFIYFNHCLYAICETNQEAPVANPTSII